MYCYIGMGQFGFKNPSLTISRHCNLNLHKPYKKVRYVETISNYLGYSWQVIFSSLGTLFAVFPPKKQEVITQILHQLYNNKKELER